jgi:hypothetical protein
MSADPRRHPAHERPLASRIVTDEITRWIRTNLAIEAASIGTTTPEERAARAAIDQAQNLALAGVDYRLTPHLLDALRRAGCLREETR